jgi:hypothetical protein
MHSFSSLSTSNLLRLIKFSETLVHRPPRIDKVPDALEKLKAYVVKFDNLSAKLNVRCSPVHACGWNADVSSFVITSLCAKGFEHSMRMRGWLPLITLRRPYRVPSIVSVPTRQAGVGLK